MQAAVDHCQTAADVWAAAARVKTWRESLKPPIRSIAIQCSDRPVVIPITGKRMKRVPGMCPAKFVIAVVSQRLGVSALEILAKRRGQKVMMARHIAIYVLKNVSLLSYPDIGRRFRRDHTTILHSVQKVERLLETDHELRSSVQSLIQECAA